MKLLFVTVAYPKGSEDYLQRLNHNIPMSMSSNTFQWAVIEGLYRNNVDFEVISQPSLCCYPFHFKKLFSPKMDMVFEGKRVGVMLKTLRLKFVSGLAGRLQLKKIVREWARKNRNEDKLIVLVYDIQVNTLNAIIQSKKSYPQLSICPIVTDLIDDLLDPVYKRSLWFKIKTKKYLKKLKKTYASIDRFVLLTRSMEEKIPEAVGRNIVVEGIALSHNTHYISKGTASEKTLLYTGSLDAHTCVTDLIDAFMLTKNPKFRLVICGTGSGSGFIKQSSKTDSRIIFKGFVSRDEAIRLQHEATVVINPRKPTISLTKYSFPSKTMEYMSSGTPMIGYRLEGIPGEYYQYMYTVDGLKPEDLAHTITEVLEKPQEELDMKAKEAMAFIANNKTAEKQVKRIIEFLSE